MNNTSNNQMNVLKKFFDNPAFNANIFNNDALFQNMRKNYLYTNYSQEKLNLETAPERFRIAEKKYYTFAKGDTWYNNYKEQQEAEKSRINTEKMIKEFKQDKKQIINSINEIDSLNIYKNNIKELKENILNEIKKIHGENQKIKNKKNINERLSVYHTRNIVKNDGYEWWFKLFYWVLLSVYIVIILLIKRIYTKESLIPLLFLLIYPFFVEWIIKILNLFTFAKIQIKTNKS
jgi:hypothetical protein